MKKILFATTALVATAGVASAEINLSGWAEMGVADNGTNTTFYSDLDIDFALRGESDNGIAFGADIDLDEAPAIGTTAPGAGQAAESVFISAGGLRVTMGDTNGAVDQVLAEMDFSAGTLADDQTGHAGFFDADAVDGVYDGQVLRLDYTFSGVNASLSIEADDTTAGANGDAALGLGLGYSANLGGVDLGIGIAYQTVDLTAVTAGSTGEQGAAYGVGSNDTWGITVTAGFGGGFSAGLSYADFDYAGTSFDHWGLGVGYSQGPITVAANYGEYSGAVSQDGWALAADYDFGGGLSAKFGYGSGTVGAVTTDTWSLGLAMSF